MFIKRSLYKYVKNVKQNDGYIQVCWHMPIIPVLRRKKDQKVKAVLDYTVNSRSV